MFCVQLGQSSFALQLVPELCMHYCSHHFASLMHSCFSFLTSHLIPPTSKDTHLYTGAHKERFDDDGHGKGKAGRVQNTGAPDLSDITDRTPADVRGRKV